MRIKIKVPSWGQMEKASFAFQKRILYFHFQEVLRPQANHSVFASVKWRVTSPNLYVTRLECGKVYEAVSPVLVRCGNVVDGFKKVCFTSRENSLTGSQAGQMNNCRARPDQPGAGSPDNLWLGPGQQPPERGGLYALVTHSLLLHGPRMTLLEHSRYSGPDSRFLEYSSIVCSCEDVFD